ncbi:MAG: sigma-70 family RNA polymerase sigma factor [Bryobacteraceae bacterium]|jgi:RNA polymerase sigma factor (TIGR02999 family)
MSSQPPASSSTISQLLESVRKGDADAAFTLMPLLYNELHRLAMHYMRSERPGHTLQATALVNEAYLKLIDQREANWESRSHFIAVAAQVMRNVLIDHARGRQRVKRGGLQQKVPLEDVVLISEEQTDDLIALDTAMKRLEEIDARQSRIVELRYFGGLTVEQTAEVLGISPKTVKRDWAVARAWLHRELRTARESE